MMDSGEFRRALSNGLGRAVLWLRDHSSQPYEEVIRHACLHSPAYDPQCEGTRGEYVFEIIRMAGQEAHFAEIAAEGLPDAKEYWDVCHLFHLNRLFAAAGHVASRQAMYETFKRVTGPEPFIGAHDLVELDRINGLLFVVEQMGGWKQIHAEYPVDDMQLRMAEDEFGPETIEAVRRAAETNSKVRTYLDAVEQYKRGLEVSSTERTDFRKLGYLELREKILAVRGKISRGRLWAWGKRASDESIRQAAADLLDIQEEGVQLAYLRMFFKRAFPLDIRRIVQLAMSENADLAQASRSVLCNITDRTVRELALQLLQTDPTHAGDAIRLLVKNYVEGDHHLIEAKLDDRSDEHAFHSTVLSALDVFCSNPQAPALLSMLKIYEHCRCSICRYGAVKLMIERQIIPPEILRECKFDSYESTREIATTTLFVPTKS